MPYTVVTLRLVKHRHFKQRNTLNQTFAINQIEVRLDYRAARNKAKASAGDF